MPVQRTGCCRAAIIQRPQVCVRRHRIVTSDGQRARGSGVGLIVLHQGPAIRCVFLIVSLSIVPGIDVVAAGARAFAGLTETHNHHDQIACGNREPRVGHGLTGHGGGRGIRLSELSCHPDRIGQSG